MEGKEENNESGEKKNEKDICFVHGWKRKRNVIHKETESEGGVLRQSKQVVSRFYSSLFFSSFNAMSPETLVYSPHPSFKRSKKEKKEKNT